MYDWMLLNGGRGYEANPVGLPLFRTFLLDGEQSRLTCCPTQKKNNSLAVTSESGKESADISHLKRGLQEKGGRPRKLARANRPSSLLPKAQQPTTTTLARTQAPWPSTLLLLRLCARTPTAKTKAPTTSPPPATPTRTPTTAPPANHPDAAPASRAPRTRTPKVSILTAAAPTLTAQAAHKGPPPPSAVWLATALGSRRRWALAPTDASHREQVTSWVSRKTRYHLAPLAKRSSTS